MAILIRADPVPPATGARRTGRAGRQITPETVVITERALGALVALRAAEHASPGQALGLVLGPGGAISLVLDLPGARDRVFSHADTPILFVDEELGPRLAGRVLDHGGEPGHERFTLERVRPIEAHLIRDACRD
jgi:hypothetical protein